MKCYHLQRNERSLRELCVVKQNIITKTNTGHLHSKQVNEVKQLQKLPDINKGSKGYIDKWEKGERQGDIRKGDGEKLK